MVSNTSIFDPFARQETLRERRPGDDRNLLVQAQRKHFAFFLAVDQVVVQLHRDETRPSVQVRRVEGFGKLPGKKSWGGLDV